MANINELEWKPVFGSDYPVAKTTITELEVSITKLDEDSYIIESGPKRQEINLNQLDAILSTNDITWTIELSVDESSRLQNPEDIEIEEIKTKLSIWSDKSLWKSIKNIGEKVLEIPHAQHKDGTLRIIKLDDYSFKTAVIGIPPNDGKEIIYQEVDGKFAFANYALAIGLNVSAALHHYENQKAESEHTDFEIVQTDSIEQTGLDVIPDEVPCVGCH